MDSNSGPSPREDSGDTGWVSGLLRLFLHLVRHWKLIGGITFTVAILSVGLVLVLPESFEAKSTLILTGGQNTTAGALAKLAGGDLGSLLTSSNDPTRNEMSVLLDADTLAMRTIRECHLERAWKMDTTRVLRREDLLRAWAGAFHDQFGEEDQLMVSFKDENPRLAQVVLASHIARIDSAWLSLKQEEATKKVRFAQEQLDGRMTLMQRRIDSLIQFQIQNRLFEPNEQIRQTVLALSELETKISGVSINRELENKESGGSNAEQLGVLSSILEAREKSLASAKRTSQSNEESQVVLLNLPNALPLAAAFEKKSRMIQLDLTVVEGLARQVEQLKIEALSNVSVLQVVDPPVIPTKRRSPPRTALVELLTLIAFVSGCTLALLIEYFRAAAGDATLLKEILRAWR